MLNARIEDLSATPISESPVLTADYSPRVARSTEPSLKMVLTGGDPVPGSGSWRQEKNRQFAGLCDLFLHDGCVETALGLGFDPMPTGSFANGQIVMLVAQLKGVDVGLSLSAAFSCELLAAVVQASFRPTFAADELHRVRDDDAARRMGAFELFVGDTRFWPSPNAAADYHLQVRPHLLLHRAKLAARRWARFSNHGTGSSRVLEDAKSALADLSLQACWALISPPGADAHIDCDDLIDLARELADIHAISMMYEIGRSEICDKRRVDKAPSNLLALASELHFEIIRHSANAMAVARRASVLQKNVQGVLSFVEDLSARADHNIKLDASFFLKKSAHCGGVRGLRQGEENAEVLASP